MKDSKCFMSQVQEESFLLLALRYFFFCIIFLSHSSFSVCWQCSGLGASFCYMLSYLVGRPVVYRYLTERAQKWSQQVGALTGKNLFFVCFILGFFVLFIYLCIFFVLCFSCTGFELHLKTHKYIAK